MFSVLNKPATNKQELKGKIKKEVTSFQTQLL
jgi:hypothetical protein